MLGERFNKQARDMVTNIMQYEISRFQNIVILWTIICQMELRNFDCQYSEIYHAKVEMCSTLQLR